MKASRTHELTYHFYAFLYFLNLDTGHTALALENKLRMDWLLRVKKIPSRKRKRIIQEIKKDIKNLNKQAPYTTT